MSSVATPPPEPPQPTSLPPGPRADLVENVRNALRALPFHFTSRTAIEGLEAGDLFSLNSVLGGTIEIQTVQNLNRLREVWDPNDQFPDYGFERFSQTFPDVRLVTRSESKPSPILGVELKGWYLLSREGEPSFRYTATREACDPFDLLVVVPWHLSNVLSGVPIVYEPYIEQARYAADYRNYYWRYQRGVKADGRIESPEDVQPYPPAKAITADKPKSDSGGNFGRVARVSGLMDWYTELRLSTRVAGIEARHWVSFFKTYADAAKADRVHERITTLLARESDRTADEQTRRIVELLEELRNLLA
ncbi:MAG: hypothetical protein ACRDRZ_07840 [Pseudonocardiaceae bacterium]